MNKSACTICSDYLTLSNCTACPCGHTFHYECIMRWKERSPTCPQCRVKFKEPIKLFFDLNSSEVAEVDTSALKNQLNDLEFKLKEKDRKVDAALQEQSKYVASLCTKQNEVDTLKQLLQNSQGTNDAMKRQLTYLEKFKVEAKRARSEATECNNKLASLANIEEMVKGDFRDVEVMIKKFADTPDSLNQIATSFVVLKKEFDKLKETKKKLEHERKNFRRQAEKASQEAYESKEQLKVVSGDLTHLNDVNKSLQDKLNKLELSFQSPSPRSSAIKRLLAESPAPFDFKRPRIIEEDNEEEGGDGSLILFDDPPPSTTNNDTDIEALQCKELANEFGLTYVATTSTTLHRAPLRDVNKNQPMKTNGISTKNIIKDKPTLAHVKKGFNGMGGQSKILVLPKKAISTVMTGTLRKQTLKTEAKKYKLPSRNNTKISTFMKNTPRLPSIE